MNDARTARYSSLFTLPSTGPRVAIVGCGAIGRPLALQIATLFPSASLSLIDFDTIDEENLGTQGWVPHDIGRSKVVALMDDIEDVNPSTSVAICDRRAISSDLKTSVVFLCVDDMDTRKELFLASEADLVVDTRMAANTAIVWPVYDQSTRELWLEEWFPQSEAAQLPCTARATNYAGSIAASLGTHALVEYLSDREPRRFELSLSNGTLLDPAVALPTFLPE